ncbi:S8/S53 family peptidase [Amycolatopsis sp. FDAARGOS 1241]|nr:S8/S53 family peptidase [Amycolatopsis sp. FDAARGOS 1241]
MTEQNFVAVPGSSRAALADAQVVGPLGAEQRITATLVLRRRSTLPTELVEGPGTLTRQELADRHGADPADIDAVTAALTAAGLEIVRTEPGSRRIVVAGSASAMTAAFGVELNVVRSNDPVADGMIEHRARSGELSVPAALDGIVVAVLGLDNRPQARPHMRVQGLHAHAGAQKSYTPDKLAAVYKFPAGTDGDGETLAILELGGGFTTKDVNTYFQDLGIDTPSVTEVLVDGGENSPSGDPNSADGEVLLDIEVAGALAPKAKQVVYFAPNTDQGFVDALSAAVHADPTPTAVSISWGASEDQWTSQARIAFDDALADAAALGVTVTAAAGDNGSSDGQADGSPHADFPASSPHVLACGGTNLNADARGTVSSETVWNNGDGGGATGGGVSDSFERPAYQTGAGVPKPPRGGKNDGRGVPDVAGDADPASGYEVLVDGRRMVIGGTSAVSPLWAALVCRLVQSLERPLGLIQTELYAGVTPGQVQPGFRDITEGDNGDYRAGPGWDACTGLGVPDGEALLAALSHRGSDGVRG